MGAFRPGAGHPHKRKELTPEEVEEVRKKEWKEWWLVWFFFFIFSPRRVSAIDGRKSFSQVMALHTNLR